jgi:glycosyltransferase involved in cell wall biosynthesis
MEQPLVSVIMSVYNGAEWLQLTIDSIIQQTYANWEFIIVDDCSKDKTIEILQKNQHHPQIKIYLREENKGLIENLNFLVQKSQGKYIARMDADDVAVADRLEAQVHFLEKNPHVDLLATTIVLIDEKGKQTGTWKDDRECITHHEIRKKIPFANCIAHPSVMSKSAVLKQNNYLSTQKNAEDWDLWLRLLCVGKVFAKIKEPKLYYRVHSNSITQQSLKQKAFVKNKRFYQSFFNNPDLKVLDKAFYKKILFAAKLNGVKLFFSNLKSAISK